MLSALRVYLFRISFSFRSSLKLIRYSKVLRLACSLFIYLFIESAAPLHLQFAQHIYWSQAKEHYNPAFHLQPQLFMQFQNIMLSNSSGAGGFMPINSSKNSSRIIMHSHAMTDIQWRNALIKSEIGNKHG